MAPAPSLASRWWVRRSGAIGYAVLALIAVVLPIVVTASSRQYLYTRIVVAAILALSVTLLTGWAGQLSLGQYGFAGIGAFLAMRLAADGRGFYLAALISVVVATVDRGLLDADRCSIAMVGGMPSISSTSGFLSCSRNCRA